MLFYNLMPNLLILSFQNLGKPRCLLRTQCHISKQSSFKKFCDKAYQFLVLHTYVEKQAILEPILLYRASKCKQTKEQGSENCLWTCIFTFLCDYYQFFFFFLPKCKYKRIKLCFNRLQFVKEIILALYQT